MNRKQRACILFAFFLILLSLLFPPVSTHHPAIRGIVGASNSVSYGFLFTVNGEIEFARLFVEWLLIALLASGFFLSQARRPSPKTEMEPDRLAGTGPTSMEGGSYFKVNYPGLTREFIGHVDDHKRVTLWLDGQPAATGLTRDQLETYGVEFEAATENAVTQHYRAENPKTFRLGKLWQRKFVIPIVVALAIPTIGLGYYGARRVVGDLPLTENSKLAGMASITNYGQFVWNAYNGSDFVLTEVRVSISVIDEKGNAIVSNRIYRVPAYDFYPQQTKELRTDVGFTLGERQTLRWNVAGAKGRPE